MYTQTSDSSPVEWQHRYGLIHDKSIWSDHVTTICVKVGRLTVVVYLVGVGHQSAVIRPRRQEVRHAVVVVVIVTLVPEAVLVRVQLGAVDHQGAVVLAVLVPVTVAAGEEEEKEEEVTHRVDAHLHQVTFWEMMDEGGWRETAGVMYLSWLVSQESPTRSWSMSDCEGRDIAVNTQGVACSAHTDAGCFLLSSFF